MTYKVLMTGAGAPGGPGIIKSLLNLDYIDLFIADANDNASGRYLLTEKFFRIPTADDLSFCDQVLNLCLQIGINVVFPLVTKELLQFSKNVETFRKHNITIIVSEKKSLATAVNKCRLYEHLNENNIELPKFKVAKTYNEFSEAAKFIGYPEKPFCIKPGFSNGSRGIRIIDNSIDKFDLLFNHKPDSLYIGFDELNSILKQKEFPELLISEVLPGEEITVDTIINNDRIELILPRKRLKMISGISVQGEFFYDEKIIDYVKRILNSLKLSGPIGIQLKQNADGDYRILEINPRIQGTSVAAKGLGINLPGLVVRNALALQNKYPSASEIKWGTRFFRFYDEVFAKNQ
jgi:carbamoyl-phosphate synthase large subunit